MVVKLVKICRQTCVFSCWNVCDFLFAGFAAALSPGLYVM